MIEGIKGGIGSIPSIQGLDQLQKPEEQSKGSSFSDALKDALGEVERLQNTADNNIKSLQTGAPNASPHEAMIALEKADVAFQLMSAIRTKIVQAYQEVVRTTV